MTEKMGFFSRQEFQFLDLKGRLGAPHSTDPPTLKSFFPELFGDPSVFPFVATTPIGSTPTRRPP
jgi:hypothetical protein